MIDFEKKILEPYKVAWAHLKISHEVEFVYECEIRAYLNWNYNISVSIKIKVNEEKRSWSEPDKHSCALEKVRPPKSDKVLQPKAVGFS